MMEITKTNVEKYAERYDELASAPDRDIEARMKEVLTTQRFWRSSSRKR